MNIWVDADALPVAIREMLFKAAVRTKIPLTLVANRALSVPRVAHIKMLQVSSGFDVADNEIVQRVVADDLVITQDIPLASEVIDKGATALSPRGEIFTTENIRARLNIRDFMETLRASGVEAGGGPAAFSQTDKQTFANQLDRWLSTAVRKRDRAK